MKRLVAVLLLATVAAACTAEERSSQGLTSTSAPPAVTTSVPDPVTAGGAATAEAAIRSLCDVPAPTGEPVEPGETPATIAEVQAQVEAVRGLEFLEPVAATPIDDATMDRKLEEAFDMYYPEALYERRTAAWATIGVIPPDADLLEAYRSYLTGQVVGFYDSITGELVYLGDQDDDLGLMERLVLAHELTHAIDDQHFDLTRLDDLSTSCQDEAFAAGLGVVEGSAQFFSTEVLLDNPDDIDLTEALGALAQELVGSQAASDVPPFVQALQQWPYLAGQAFVTEIAIADGDDAIDGALRDLPETTEQILHPDRYPSDVPARVDLPDLSAALGEGWGDLDAMEVGEAWLAAMLDLRLDADLATSAADGWDGGVYRAWTDGNDVVVALNTAWDTPEEAEAFADALGSWLDAGDTVGTVLPDGVALFATDEAQLVAAVDGLRDPTT